VDSPERRHAWYVTQLFIAFAIADNAAYQRMFEAYKEIFFERFRPIAILVMSQRPQTLV
jgi:hypothetical protein